MLTAELVKHPKSIFVTLTPGAVERLSITLLNRAFSLEETAELDDDARLQIDLEKIEAILGSEKPEPTKKTARRGNRTANIEKLTHEVYRHLLSARDHLCETGDLLPKPSLQQLGKMVGLAKHDVTRCMQDPDADKLRHCWKFADDVEFVRKWKAK